MCLDALRETKRVLPWAKLGREAVRMEGVQLVLSTESYRWSSAVLRGARSSAEVESRFLFEKAEFKFFLLESYSKQKKALFCFLVLLVQAFKMSVYNHFNRVRRKRCDISKI